MADSAWTTRAVAIPAVVGLLIIATFQVALALGAPWGRAAYGGTSETLSPELRVASGVAAIVWLLAAAVVLGRAGYWGRTGWFAVFRWGTWLVAGLLALGAVVNFASSSPWERFGWGPLALVLAVLAVLLARSQSATAGASSPPNSSTGD
jgi:hypothetical protein